MNTADHQRSASNGPKLFSVLRKTTTDFKTYLHLTERLEETDQNEQGTANEAIDKKYGPCRGKNICCRDMEQGDSSTPSNSSLFSIADNSSLNAIEDGIHGPETSCTDFKSVHNYEVVTGDPSISSISTQQQDPNQRYDKSEEICKASPCRTEQCCRFPDQQNPSYFPGSQTKSQDPAVQSLLRTTTHQIPKHFIRDNKQSEVKKDDRSQFFKSLIDQLDEPNPETVGLENAPIAAVAVTPTSGTKKFASSKNMDKKPKPPAVSLVKKGDESPSKVKGNSLQVHPRVEKADSQRQSPAKTTQEEMIIPEVIVHESEGKYIEPGTPVEGLSLSSLLAKTLSTATAKKPSDSQNNANPVKEVIQPVQRNLQVNPAHSTTFPKRKLHVDVSAQCVSPLIPYGGEGGGKCQYGGRPRLLTRENETQMNEGSLLNGGTNTVSSKKSLEELSSGQYS